MTDAVPDKSPCRAKRLGWVAGGLILGLCAGGLRAEVVGAVSEVRAAFSPRGDALTVLLDELKRARRSVDAALYYLSNDALVEALCYLAADERVRVRLMVDQGMAAAAHRATLDRLVRCGAEVWVEDLPSAGKLHLKTAVIDGETVVTGSANWTETAFAENCDDTLVIQSARMAATYLRGFENVRAQCRPHVAESAPADAPDRFPDVRRAPRDRTDLRLVAPRTQSFRDVLRAEVFLTPSPEGIERLRESFRAAVERIDVAIYYLSDPGVLETLCDVARGGRVKVRLIADDVMLAGGQLQALQQLHDAGVTVLYIQEDRASMHLKTAVIDRGLVVAGSHNWTPAAADNNVEDMVFLTSRRLATHYRGYLDYLARVHARPYQDIEQSTSAETARIPPDGRSGFPDTLPATGPRTDYTNLAPPPDPAPFELNASLEYLDDAEYLDALLTQVAGARQSIVASMYHLSPGSRSPSVEQVLQALEAAAQRGVYVYLVLDMPLNPSDPRHASHSDAAERLRRAGVDARLAVPGVTLHEKAVVIDLAKILIGSHNWSEGSLNGAGAYEAGALMVLPAQDLRVAQRILRHPVVSDMRSRDAWEQELSALRHLDALSGTEREAYVLELQGQAR